MAKEKLIKIGKPAHVEIISSMPKKDKPKVYQTGPFSHYISDEEVAKEQCSSAAGIISASYLEPRISIDIDYDIDHDQMIGSTNTGLVDNSCTRRIVANIKRIQNMIGNVSRSYRIITKPVGFNSNTYSYWVRDIYIKSIKTGINTGDNMVHSDGAIVYISDFMEPDLMLTFALVIITRLDDADAKILGFINKDISTLIFPMYITKNNVPYVRLESLMFDPSTNIYWLNILAHHLNEIRKHCDDPADDVCHSPLEVFCYQRMLKYVGIGIKFHQYIPVRTFFEDGDGERSLLERNHNEIYEQDVAFSYDHSEYPLLDFNIKEEKFTRRYLDKKYPEGSPINLITYLRSPQWGNTLRVKAQFSSDQKPVMETIRFSIDVEKNEASMYIFDNTYYSNFTMIIEIHLRNIDKWVGADNVEWIECGIMLRSSNVYFTSMKEAYENIFNTGLLNGYTENLHAMVRYTIAAFVLMHDRPKRMVMINERFQVESKKKRKKDEEPDYVIRRILKPASEAGPYIERMKRERGINYQYTCEEWVRKGHYRRLPHSDQTIWIPETTCKRHLPLSEKEIHLKL